jgi:hypothetical protein
MILSRYYICGLVVRVSGYRSRGLVSIPCSAKEVVGLEKGPLSLVSTIKELFGINSSGLSLENREYGHRDLLH